MSPVLLYTQRLNPFSQKVVVALDLKGIDFERVVSDLPEDVKRWSPVTGRLPVLEIGRKRVAESSAILRWLDELYPTPPLWSRDPKIASAQDQLMEWADASFLFYWDRWRMARYPQPGDGQPANPSILATLRRRVERTFGGDYSAPTRIELREIEVLEELAHRLDDLVGMLGQRPFFLSDEPSVADLSIFGMLRVIRDGPMLRGDEMVERREPLVAYMERMEKLSPGSSLPLPSLASIL